MEDIKQFEQFKIITPVDKGWSDDKKFHITAFDGEELLLRISDVSLYERRKSQFETMQKIALLDAKISIPIDFGICNAGSSVYGLFKWCVGDDAECVIQTLSGDLQYLLGVKAGKMLSLIHSLPAPHDAMSWDVRFSKKVIQNIKMYQDCSVKIKGDTLFINYLENNMKLLENRPQCYQHGDYHIGNMIISPSNELYVIDFNRDDYGDPWEEFNRIVWCAQASPDFACGYVDGYFGKRIPDEFWKLLAFYIASNTMSSIPWAIPFGKNEVKVMVSQSQEVLHWFDGFTKLIPSWYKSRVN